MVTNFEEITEELSQEELEFVHLIVKSFLKYTKTNPIKAYEIVARFNAAMVSKELKMRMNEPRLRKFVNHIRSKAIIPIIATSRGYYVSFDQKEIEDQVRSLNERAASIRKCAMGLNNFIAPGP